MQENYRESGAIRAVTKSVSQRDRIEDPYLFDEITILTPRTDKRSTGEL